MADPVSEAPTLPGQPDQLGRPAPLRPGMVVGDTYEITRVIGQGGMGAVWEAKHLRLPGKRVVVKVLLYGGADAIALARFRREAEIGSRLGHPNIVQVLDFNTLPGGAPYLVLELLEGETLASRLRRGPLPPDQVVGVVRQVGAALQAAHREGIVHRDLKPDNIFLCPTDVGGEVRDVVKVLDFGISKIRGARTVLTQDSALIGTPQYMAPEQATGSNEDIDPRTDVFAMGAIAFEMVAGRPPFWGDTLASVIHAVVYAPSPSLAEVAPGTAPAVAAAVERALAKSREARFPDVASFVRAFTGAPAATPPSEARAAPAAGGTIALGHAATVASDVIAGGSPSATTTAPQRLQAPPGPAGGVPTDRVERPQRTRPAWVIAGLALIGAGAVAGALVWFRRPPEPAPRVSAAPAAARVNVPAPAAEKAPAPEAPPPRPPAPVVASKARPLAPAAAADLERAEAALGAGESGEAIRLAQHSLYAQKSGRAYAVIARARCAQGDLGNAKAAFANVDAGARAEVARACRKHGVELR